MKNYWPEKFEESAKPPAKNLLEEQARLLPKLTGDIVFAEVAEELIKTRGWPLNGDFMYRFDIKGKFLENYRFHVLSFSHDITLYPVRFLVDEEIGNELRIEKESEDRFTKTIDAPEDLEGFLSAVLTSERVKSVVGSIMRLSK